MKQKSRRLLSLLMAFAIMLSLFPTAFAADGELSIVAAPSGEVQPGKTVILHRKWNIDESVSGYDYKWTLFPGVNSGVTLSPALTGLNATLSIPDTITEKTSVTIMLEATERTSSTDRKTYTAIQMISIVPEERNECSISLNQTNVSLQTGQRATVTASAKTAGGTDYTSYFSYTWTRVSGSDNVVSLSSGTGRSVTFTAVNPGTVTYRVTGSSIALGTPTYAEVTFTVTAASVSEPAIVTSANTYTSGQTVTAELSNAAGTSQYNWVVGAEVNGTIENPISVSSNGYTTASFVCPEVASSTTLAIYCYYQDAQGNSRSAYKTITVTPSANTPRITLSSSSLSVPVNSYQRLTATISGVTNPSDYTVRWSVSNTRISATEISTSSTATRAVNIYGNTAGSATVTAYLLRNGADTGVSATCAVTVGSTSFQLSLSKSPNTSSVTLSYYDDYYYDDWYYNNRQEFYVTPSATFQNTSLSSRDYSVSYYWELTRYNSTTNLLSSSNRNSSSLTLYASSLDYYASNNNSYTLTCTATGSYTDAYSNRYTDSKKVSWSVYRSDSYQSDISVSATVYDTSSGYCLDDRDDKNSTSIIDQIENKLRSSEYLESIRFSNVTSTYGSLNASTNQTYYYDSRSSSRYDLSDVVFTPDRAGRTGTASFNCTIYTNRTSYYGTIKIYVEEGDSSSGSDVKYSAQAGSNVEFKTSDFREWWTDRYSRGTLSYVQFTSVSNGSLYSNYNGSSGNTVVSSSNPTSCYASPSSRQTGISDLTFVPRSSSITTATLRFTAYGTTSSSSSRNESRSGTVTITFVNSSAAVINYSTTGTKPVTLSSSDFTSRYRDVVGSTASTITIRFRSVPSNGTLAFKNTTLTSSNISNYDFSSSSSSSTRISDVTYTPKNDSATDTIRYDCYSGSTLRFSGSITFTTKPEPVTIPTGVAVSYTCTGTSVNFAAADFYNKNSAMLAASYLVFGTPSSGTLYVGSAAVTSGTKFGYVTNPANTYQNISSVSYRPAAGYSGTATVPFTAYNANGTQAAAGSVSILVAPSNTSAAPKFSDVPSTAWYYNDVTTLAAANIVNGRNDGLFHPNDAVNYGEALKLILLASGYPLQTELSGAAWAQNYLNLAVSNSILSGKAADYNLSKSIDRNSVASVAAKALKLTPVTGGTSPYSDTNDGYVLALTNAGIVQGDASSGTQKWRGTDTLTRAEISRIVYNVYKYRNVTPGGTTATTTPTTPDTNQPSWLS